MDPNTLLTLISSLYGQLLDATEKNKALAEKAALADNLAQRVTEAESKAAQVEPLKQRIADLEGHA